MADKEAERIKFETEVFRLAVLLVVAVGGGSISLLFGDLTSFRLMLAGAGLLATIGLAVFIGWQQRYIHTLIEQIQEDR
jgi:small neutral amino acid transporter SnatA (MarC family)